MVNNRIFFFGKLFNQNVNTLFTFELNYLWVFDKTTITRLQQKKDDHFVVIEINCNLEGQDVQITLYVVNQIFVTMSN